MYEVEQEHYNLYVEMQKSINQPSQSGAIASPPPTPAGLIPQSSLNLRARLTTTLAISATVSAVGPTLSWYSIARF